MFQYAVQLTAATVAVVDVGQQRHNVIETVVAVVIVAIVVVMVVAVVDVLVIVSVIVMFSRGCW